MSKETIKKTDRESLSGHEEEMETHDNINNITQEAFKDGDLAELDSSRQLNAVNKSEMIRYLNDGDLEVMKKRSVSELMVETSPREPSKTESSQVDNSSSSNPYML